jgi:NAD(P)-dependent dehydrogenase (short-subunit alcohol dehydrogenase family)
MLVLGANKGIGKAICQLLLSRKITPNMRFLLKS